VYFVGEATVGKGTPPAVRGAASISADVELTQADGEK
jgi:hypothetical protein